VQKSLKKLYIICTYKYKKKIRLITSREYASSVIKRRTLCFKEFNLQYWISTLQTYYIHDVHLKKEISIPDY